MKNKKTYNFFICYSILIAFIGVISLQFLTYSKTGRTKTEISTKSNGINTDFFMLFEEDEEDTSLHAFAFLTLCFIGLSAFIIFKRKNYELFIYKIVNSTITLKKPLFISIRTLRI